MESEYLINLCWFIPVTTLLQYLETCRFYDGLYVTRRLAKVLLKLLKKIISYIQLWILQCYRTVAISKLACSHAGAMCTFNNYTQDFQP